MIPANVSIGALLDENKRLRAELARRDEQIAAVRALADEWADSDVQDPFASIYMDDAAASVTEALGGGAS